jgi:uncharacterized repeat protein (TIGR01451 family)
MKRTGQTYKKRFRLYQNIRTHIFGLLAVICLFLILAVNQAAAATWPAPGDWPVWGSQPANITPVAWTAEVNWVSYTSLGSPLADPAFADPSNGGTSPQNYVSVTSNCPDKTLPSVYWYYDSANQVIFFRFRLAAIPNTYATGPSAGSASTTDAWRSAQWSVLIDIDGDGYREFAMQLDGSTGGPGTPVDRLSIIYSATQNNSLDYNDPGASVYLVNQFPTAYVNTSGGMILNFHNSSSPDTNWPNGSSETVWDYGMTRSTNGSTPGCTEYIADYQIPLAMLDATAVGGPVITSNTPLSFLFTTANSLQNPFQKDVVTTDAEIYIGDPNAPGPFGDTVTLDGGSIPQATVVSISASGCAPVTLGAEVNNAVIISGGNAVTSVTAVEFYYYEDTNGNGIEDDANTWTLIGSGTTTNSPIGTWTATWDSTALVRGSYLIGARATNGQGNITWSWVDPADIGLIGPTPPNYANSTDPGVVYTQFTNICGAPPPYAVKTSDAVAPLSPGAPVTFTITVYNTGSSPLTVSSITDSLHSGFIYQSTGGGTLGAPSGSPTPGDTGVLTWTFPPASVPDGANRTLIFTCTASTTAGTYSNSASVQSSVGTLDTEPTQVSVGSPQLTVTKSASAASVAPGNTLIYTIGYANTSPVNVTGVTISEPLPDGVTYVSNTGGGVYNGGTSTVSWTIGNLAAGASGTVTVTVTVDNPFPASASIPMENTASLTSNESGPTSASTSVFVSAPRPMLAVQKSASSSTVNENNDVTFTISYANTGNATATSLTLTDPVPNGLTFVSASGGGTYSSGTVTWNLPDLAPNATGSVTVTLHVPTGYTGANPLTNIVSLSATGVSPVTDSFRLGVNQTTDICTTYYFTDTSADVGADGTHRIANTTVPTGPGTNWSVTTLLNQVYQEALRFYTDPATVNGVDFSGDLTTTIYIDRAPGNGITIQTFVYDYDPASGSKVELGTDEQLFLGSTKGALSFTVTLSGTLAKGHRLQWIYNIKSNNNTATDTIYFQFGGTVTNPISAGTTDANSNAYYCVSPPANLIIDKQVDQLTAGPGDTLTYSILFSNTGQTAATDAQITDTLPPGVTYFSATLNGGPTAPASISGQDYTFNVNSSDTGTPGQVTGGQSGILEITVTIDSPLGSGIDSLLNSASLISTQTQAVIDTASTTVLRPDVTVSKSADLTLVGPGDTVTYTFTIINSGTGDATNVTLNDVLPVLAYYNYVSGSTTLNGAPTADNVSGGTLNFNIGTLTAGQVAVVTLQMAAGAAGTFPGTQTNLSNTAAVSDDETSGTRTSNTMTVTINPLPNLTISKSLNPAGPYAAGDTITCQISVSNNGGSAAFGVLVTDNIPVFTSYKFGSLVYNGSSQTDAPGDDIGNYDSQGNRVVFQLGTLASGVTRTLSFQVIVQYPMITGTSILSNTAQVTAVNTAAKSDTVTGTIEAEPILSVTKFGPFTSPFPAAEVTAASSGISVQVDDASPFIVSQYIRVAGQNRKITAISGNTLTVDSAITVTNGDAVTGSISYSLQYANTGTANAIDTVLVDTLPAGAIYVVSTGGGVYASGPGTVTWNLGTLAVSSSGSVHVTIFPGSAGSLVNNATITATGATPDTASFTTGVGGLRLSKSTTTPVVNSGGTANYIIEVTNTSANTAVDVVVTDILAPGFTYSGTVSISGGTRTSTSDPTVGDQVPSWGVFSIASGATLTITFNAAVAAGIQGTYDNELSATSSNTPVGTFDPLLTTAEDVTVTDVVLPPPSGSLVSTGDISVGCTATLNWTAANATSGTLNPGSISVPVGNGSGGISVTPVITTTYTLTLTGPGGTASYNATVTVTPAPVITAFSALPTNINAGDPVTFSATFTGGSGIITPGDYPITSGGTYVLATGPSVSTVYTLKVTAPCGAASQDTASATIAVGNAPFGSLVSTGDISVGCTAALNWTAANATSGTLNPGNISVPVGNGSGSILVTPATTTTYTMTLTGPGGTTSYNATVTVNPAPIITSFSALPTAIDAGDPVTFSAAFTGGIGVITPGNYPITSGGTYVLPVGPNVSTVFTLTVTAPCGPASQTAASITVTVGGNPPTGSLRSTGAISAGCTTILNWTANDATSGTLNPGNIPIPVENGSGRISVTPTTTTTYTLTLSGPGGTASYKATVTVNPAPVIIDFTAAPATITAGDVVTFSATFTGGTGVITPGDYPITSGGTYVLDPGPNSTTVYTLKVTAPCGPASRARAQTTVRVISNRLDALKSAADVNGSNLMPGDEILYFIMIISPNDEDLAGVEFSDAIPANTTYVEGSAAGPIGSVVVMTDNTLYFSNITVPARGQVILIFRVRVEDPLAPEVKEISNQGIVSYDKNGDGENDTRVFSEGDTVLPGQQPTILPLSTGPNFNDTVKSVTLVRDKNNDGLISPGDTVRYKIEIINSGDTDANGVVFRDTIPLHTDYVTNRVTSAYGTASYDKSTNQIQWTGNVPVGGVVTITFDVVVHTGITQKTLISNQGIIEYDSNEDGMNDTELPTDGHPSLPGRQPTEFIVSGISSIPATKTATPVNNVLPTPGDVLRYEIVLNNPTGYLLLGLELVDSIPANTTLVPGSISVPPGTVVVSETPTIRITGISIQPFSQAKITFEVLIDPWLGPGIDRIVNQGTINFDQDGDGFNDKGALTDWNPALPGKQPTVNIITCPLLEVTDTSLVETVECTGEIEYFIEYTNISAASAKNVVLKSVYDFKVAFQSAFPAPDPGTDDTWTIGTVEPGQTGSIRLKVKVIYRMPFLHIVPHLVILTSNCDTRQAGTRTYVIGCGPR